MEHTLLILPDAASDWRVMTPLCDLSYWTAATLGRELPRLRPDRLSRTGCPACDTLKEELVAVWVARGERTALSEMMEARS